MKPYSMPVPVRPNTYPDLLHEIGKLTAGTAAGTNDAEVERWAFRGLLNAGWDSPSSLWRDRGPRHRSESDLRSAERKIVLAAEKWLATEGLSGGLSTANILTHLQHHGVPTRLLDLTSDPFTALYFACQEGTKGPVDGKILSIDLAKLRTFRTDEHQVRYRTDRTASEHDNWEHALELSETEARPFIVQPAVRDARMRAQSGFFLASAVPSDAPENGFPLVGMYPPLPQDFGPGSPNPTSHYFDDWEYRVVQIIVPAEIKSQLRAILRSTFGKSPRDLFPDISGFVQFNSSWPQPDDPWEKA